MDTSASGHSSLYLFEKFEVGVIHLDAQRKVLAMNDFARKVLPVDEKQPFDRIVTSFHPERSQPKVGFLLDQASACPVANATPMTMIINIPAQSMLRAANLHTIIAISFQHGTRHRNLARKFNRTDSDRTSDRISVRIERTLMFGEHRGSNFRPHKIVAITNFLQIKFLTEKTFFFLGHMIYAPHYLN